MAIEQGREAASVLGQSIIHLLAAGPDGRCRSVDASFGWAAQAGRGKSELHRAVCRITSGQPA